MDEPIIDLDKRAKEKAEKAKKKKGENGKANNVLKKRQPSKDHNKHGQEGGHKLAAAAAVGGVAIGATAVAAIEGGATAPPPQPVEESPLITTLGDPMTTFTLAEAGSAQSDAAVAMASSPSAADTISASGDGGLDVGDDTDFGDVLMSVLKCIGRGIGAMLDD